MFNPYILILVLAVTVAAFSQILLKISAQRSYNTWWKEYINPYVIGGYGMLFGSMILDIVAFTKVDYKNGPVLETLGNILVPLLSFLILKEKMTKRKILGTIVIISGILVFYL